MANGNNPQRARKLPTVATEPVFRPNTRNHDPADWGSIDPTILRCAVDTITRAGGAVMFSVTSDGGAYSICVLHGDKKIKEYPHGKEDTEATLQALADWFVDFVV